MRSKNKAKSAVYYQEKTATHLLIVATWLEQCSRLLHEGGGHVMGPKPITNQTLLQRLGEQGEAFDAPPEVRRRHLMRTAPYELSRVHMV